MTNKASGKRKSLRDSLIKLYIKSPPKMQFALAKLALKHVLKKKKNFNTMIKH